MGEGYTGKDPFTRDIHEHLTYFGFTYLLTTSPVTTSNVVTTHFSDVTRLHGWCVEV